MQIYFPTRFHGQIIQSFYVNLSYALQKKHAKYIWNKNYIITKGNLISIK